VGGARCGVAVKSSAESEREHGAGPGSRPSANAVIFQPGQPFNPYGLFNGIHIPEALVRCKDLSPGAKITYGRLARYAGQGGACHPRQDTLAYELGVSGRQVRTYLGELVRHRFLRAIRKGLHAPNDYIFLGHAIFNGTDRRGNSGQGGTDQFTQDRKDTSTQDRKDTSTQDRQKASGQERQKASVPISRESGQESQEEESQPSSPLHDEIPNLDSPSVVFIEKGPSSSSTPTPGETLISGQQPDAGSSDDESVSKSTTGQTEPDSEDSQPLPAKPVSLETAEPAGEADPLMGREPLPKVFLLRIAERLREASGFDGSPDLPCARTIAECFRGKGKVVLADWIWSAAERNLGAKTKAQGPFRYGLFMRDAEASAAAGKFPLSEHAQSEMRLREAAEAGVKAKLTQQQAEAERAHLMATPLPIDEAVKVLRAERNVRDNQDLTPAFIRSIRAERDTISPGELAATAASWQPCVKCRAGGLTGHDLNGTLAYCDCPVGRQSRREHGDAWPAERVTQAQQIEAELKAREAALVERIRELKRKDEGRRQPRATGPVNEVEALKVPDKPDSLVASITCKCGAEIRQYADRVVGACTCHKVKPMSQATQVAAKCWNASS
jgi:hypothetical protein